jgi:hypothetical protein
MSRRSILLTTLSSFGFLLMSIGGDSLNIGHVEYFSTLSGFQLTSFTYHVVSIGLLIFGFALNCVAAEVCRRADARTSAAIPGIRLFPSLGPILIPAFFIPS